MSQVAMAIGAVGAILGLQAQSFPIFFLSFLWLFVFTGIGNGSVYRMIPAVFRENAAGTDPGSLLRAKKAAAGCIGIAGAIAVNGYDGFMYSIGFLVAWLVALLLVAYAFRSVGTRHRDR